MSMRPFDVVGAVTVSAWIVLLVAYTIKVNVLDVPLDMNEYASEGVVFTPGNTWMVLLRENEEIGYIHEARSAIDDGWLLEYEMLMSIDLVGQTQTIDTTMRAILDKDAYLEEFTASVDSVAGTFSVEGKAEAEAIEMTLMLGAGAKPQQRSIPISEPVRLNVSALNEITASNDLQVGRDYTQSFFDPVSMGQSELTYTYVGRDTVDSYEVEYDVHHFRQQVMGNELDVYINDAGEIVIQELPLRTLGAKIPGELGRLRSTEIRRTLKKKQKEADKALGVKPDTTLLDGILPKDDAAPLDLNTAMQRLSETLNGPSKDAVSDAPARWLVRHVDEGMMLELNSSRQRVIVTPERVGVSRSGTTMAVEITAPDAQSPAPEDLAPFLAATPRVDHDSDVIAGLVEGIDPASPPEERVRSIVSAVSKAMSTEPNAAIQSAAAALTYGKGDCTEYALITIAAMRRLGLPARFAQGVLLTDGATAAHQWAQYWDAAAGQWVDVDALEPAGETTDAHLQLYTSLEPEHPGMLYTLSKVKFERLVEEPAPAP